MEDTESIAGCATASATGNPLRLRGHHVAFIERRLRDMLGHHRGGGEYDFMPYFELGTEVHGRVYGEPHIQNHNRLHRRLFEEDPLVVLVDSPDDICLAPCRWLGGEEGVECTNPYAGNGDGNHRETTRILKEGDAKDIRQRLGLSVGDVKRFSEIFRRIIDRGLFHVWFGYEPHDPEPFRMDLEKFFHPRLAEIYRQGAALTGG